MRGKRGDEGEEGKRGRGKVRGKREEGIVFKSLKVHIQTEQHCA